MCKRNLVKVLFLMISATCILAGCNKKEETKTEQDTISAEADVVITEEEIITEGMTEKISEEAAEEITEAADPAQQEGDTGTTISAAGWNITAEDYQISDSLENISVELGYTGVETSGFEKKAEDGKTFCMIKMLIEKDGSKEVFQWNRLKLVDQAGNEYERLDDGFLTELGMKRMAGTDLNFGSNEGWIAFEIAQEAGGLQLQYSFDSETVRYVL